MGDWMFEHREAKVTLPAQSLRMNEWCVLRKRSTKKKGGGVDFNSRENMVVQERKCNYGVLPSSAEDIALQSSECKL